MSNYQPNPGEPKSHRMAIKLYPSLADRVKRAARAERRSVNDAINGALGAWTDDVERRHKGLPELPVVQRTGPHKPTTEAHGDTGAPGGIDDILRRYRK